MSGENVLIRGDDDDDEDKLDMVTDPSVLSFVVDILLGCATRSLPSGTKVSNYHKRDFWRGVGD